MNNVLLIGTGLYGRSCYVDFFLRKNPEHSRLVAAIDLVSQRETIINYFQETGKLFPNNPMSVSLYFLENVLSEQQVLNLLRNLKEENQLTHVIISTPPEHRMNYYKASLELDLHILADKPLTAPKNISNSSEAISEFLYEYNSLRRLYRGKKDLKFDVMVQRRYHPIFQLISQKLIEVSEYTGCPLTHFQATHADGQWRFPQEMIDLDYHGCNQGQGKISHSGYHFFDIVTRFLRQTLDASGKSIDNVSAYSVPTFPEDCFASFTNEDYQRLFPNYKALDPEEFHNQTKGFGEIDCLTTLNFLDRGKSICSGNLNLLHNSFSGRSWHEPHVADLYRSNGRLRQELHYYVQGPFQSITLTSLRGCSKVPAYQRVGESREPLEVHVFRNIGINPKWKNYEKFTIESEIPDLKNPDAHLQYARDNCIEQFLNGKTQSNLMDHTWATIAMASACRSIVEKKAINSIIFY